MVFVLLFAIIFPVAEKDNNRKAQETFTAAVDEMVVSIKDRPANYEGKKKWHANYCSS